MRKLFILLMALALVAGFSTVSYAEITGSAHDFSAEGWNPTGEICVVCHTPHHADTTVAGSPLWNHEVTVATFTLYSSPTLDETPEQPGGVSKLCLSCHDGTVALDSFGGNTGSTFITGPGLIGTDLSDDHPVSIYWSHQTESDDCGQCHGAPDPSAEFLPFFDHKVECATCHDAHNTRGYDPLLQRSNAGSLLCLTCHQK